MKKYWFKSKMLGYGFVPFTWEGWVTTLVLLILILLSAYTNNIWEESNTEKEEFRFILDVVILGCLFTALYKDKVEGGLRWRLFK